MATKKKSKKTAGAEPDELALTPAEVKDLIEAYASLTGNQRDCLKAFDRLALAGESTNRRAIAKELGKQKGDIQAPIRELKKKKFLKPVYKMKIDGYELTARAKRCLKMVR